MHLGITAGAAKELSDKNKKDVDLDNLSKLKENVVKQINKAAKEGRFETKVSYPENPEVNTGNRQFLITKSRKHFDMYYDSKIEEMLSVEGFNISSNKTKDNRSGVSHVNIQISWDS